MLIRHTPCLGRFHTHSKKKVTNHHALHNFMLFYSLIPSLICLHYKSLQLYCQIQVKTIMHFHTTFVFLQGIHLIMCSLFCLFKFVISQNNINCFELQVPGRMLVLAGFCFQSCVGRQKIYISKEARPLKSHSNHFL